jgi:hypothetical protein
MNSRLAEVAANVRAASKGGAGSWIKQGRGIAVVKRLLLEQKFGGLTFLAELMVESSQSLPDAEITPESGGKPELANSPGSSFTFLCKLEGEKKKKDTAYKNMKTFLYELLDESEESLTKAAAERKARFAAKTEAVPAWFAAQGGTADSWSDTQELMVVLDRVTSSDQPCAGMAIRYETARVTTGTGKRITVANWACIKTQDANTIAARKAAIDAAPVAAQ